MDHSHPETREDAAEVGVNVTVAVQDAETGKLLELFEEHNLVTDAGRNLIRDLLNSSGALPLTHLAVGSSLTPPAAADTALGAEILRDVFTKRATGTGTLTLTYFLSSTAANGTTLREAGLFNAATAGSLFARAVHDAIAKTSSITVTYTWQITITAI